MYTTNRILFNKMLVSSETVLKDKMKWFFNNDTNGQPSIRRYDKGDDYNFAIINCPHLDSNIPTAPAYGVYISQLVRYARACSLYPDYWQRRRILRTKLLNQGLLKNHFILSFKTVSEDTKYKLHTRERLVYYYQGVDNL
jgi:hypothetical protein